MKISIKFQPTLPARGATWSKSSARMAQSISTHAPRTGSDKSIFLAKKLYWLYFNPRSPHGERHSVHAFT